MAVTLEYLREQVLERADMVNSKFISPELLDAFINQSAKKLYKRFVLKSPENVQEAVSFSIDGTSDDYDLPATVLLLIAVDYQAGGRWRDMKTFLFNERNRYQTGSANIRYRVIGKKIRFVPRAPAQTLQLWGVLKWVDLVDADDTIDWAQDFEEFIIVDAAIKCLDKEESDANELRSERASLAKDIEEFFSSKDAGHSERIQDVTGSGYSHSGLSDEVID